MKEIRSAYHVLSAVVRAQEIGGLIEWGLDLWRWAIAGALEEGENGKGTEKARERLRLAAIAEQDLRSEGKLWKETTMLKVRKRKGSGVK